MNDLERHRKLKPDIRASREATQFPLKNLRKTQIGSNMYF